ncbi:MAG TPA: Fe-S cluster assembly protein SufD [Rhizomicrobium sp.]|jgi:Fe-S cluster assembly protein SufD|nr:Fe-S cluster assembly protein SufD [Rhizomicrobium sp.]
MSARVTAENLFPQEFEPHGEILSPSWFEPRRVKALRDFRASGIPHRRIEEWKYSDLRNALESPSPVAPAIAGPASPDPFSALAGARLVTRDGCLQSHAAPAGVELFDLSALNETAPDWVTQNLGEVLTGASMGQASLALMRGGVAMCIARGISEPIHLRFLQNAGAVHGRVLIVVEEGASLVLLESHAGVLGLTNLGLEFVLQPNAQVTHIRLAGAAPEAVQVEEIGIRVARDARYRGHFSQGGAKLSRVELAIALDGGSAEAELSGATVLGGKLHADVTTHISHAAGKTTSRQLFKLIAGGNSRAAYQGRITVCKGADGSDSRQTAKALLLGARAEADLKPELEILADDVKCAHGAAVGDLDADSLFYLCSRGIPEAEARTLLIRGFLEEAVAEIEREDVRGAVWHFLENALPSVLEAAP